MPVWGFVQNGHPHPLRLPAPHATRCETPLPNDLQWHQNPLPRALPLQELPPLANLLTDERRAVQTRTGSDNRRATRTRLRDQDKGPYLRGVTQD